MPLDTIFVVHTTRDVRNAGTNADFALEIEWVVGIDGRGRPLVHRIPLLFPDLPHNEQERGRTDSYRFEMSGHRIGSDRSFDIYMHMLNTEDGWLPESLFVIGIGSGFGHVVLDPAHRGRAVIGLIGANPDTSRGTSSAAGTPR